MNFPLKFVQILRGFAAMAVLLYHLDILWQQYFGDRLFSFQYGELGVDFFFALSGFIITYVHFKDIGRPAAVKSFLAKRFIRIFPFYWLVMLAAVTIDPSKFVGSIHFVKDLLLFRLPISTRVLGVAWSLTFEIVFYAVFAIAIVVGWNITRYLLLAWVVLIVINVGDTFANFPLLHVLAGNLIIEFLMGCLAGYLVVKKRLPLHVPFFVAASLVFSTLVVLLLYFESDRFSLPVVATIGFTSAIIISFAALLDEIQRFRAAALPVLVLTGDASYAIYLTHTLYLPYVLTGAKRIAAFATADTVGSVIIFGIVFVICVALGIFIHLAIEKPLLVYLRRKFRLQKPAIVRSI